MTIIAAAALLRGRRHAQGVRAKVIEIRLQRQVGARGRQCLVVLAGAVPGR